MVKALMSGEVVMLRAQYDDKAIMVVEGDGDSRFLACFIDDRWCELVIAEGMRSKLRRQVPELPYEMFAIGGSCANLVPRAPHG